MGHHHHVPRPGYHDGLDVIAGYGNRPGIDYMTGQVVGRVGHNWVQCHDGFVISVCAGHLFHCLPRPAHSADAPPSRFDLFHDRPFDYRGPYTHFELGFPSARPEPWDLWEPLCDDPQRWNETIYPYVPYHLVRRLIDSHGGFHRFARREQLQHTHFAKAVRNAGKIAAKLAAVNGEQS